MKSFRLASIIVIIIFTALALFLRSSFFSSLVTPFVIKTVKGKTGLDLEIERTYVSLFPPRVGVDNLKCAIPSIGVVRVRKLSAGVSIVKFFIKKIELKNILIDSPEILLKVPDQEKSEKKKDTSPPPVVLPVLIHNMNIKNGRVSVEFSGSVIDVKSINLNLYADLSKPRFDTKLTLKDINLKIGKQLADISMLRSEFHYSPGLLKFDTIEVVLDENKLTVSGEVSNPETKPDLNLKAGGLLFAGSLHRYSKDFPEFKGKVEFTSAIKGTLENLTYSGNLHISGAGLGELYFGNVATEFSGDLNQVRFHNTAVELAGGKIQTEGAVFLKGKPGIKVFAKISDISFAPLLDSFTLHDSHVDALIDGEAMLSGSFSPFELAGKVDITFKNFRIMESSYTSIVNKDIFNIRADTRIVSPIVIDTHKVELSSAVLYAGDDTISADVYLGYDNFMKISYKARHFPLSLVFPIADFNMKGFSEIEGIVEGEYSNPLIKGKVRISESGMMFFNFGDVEGDVEFYDMVLRLDNLNIYADDLNVSGNCKVDFHNPMSISLDANIEYAELGKLVWLLGLDASIANNFTGVTTGNISLKGSIDDLSGDISVMMESISIYGINFDSGNAEITLSGNNVNINELSLKGSPQFVYLTGTGNYREKTVRGEFIFSNLQLSQISDFKDLPVSGNLLSKGRVFYSPNGFGGAVDLLLEDLVFAGGDLGSSSISAELDGWAIKIGGELFNKGAWISSTLFLRSPYKYSLELKINDLVFDSLVKYYLAVQRPVGIITGLVKADGYLNELKRSIAEIKIESLKIGEKNHYLENITPIRVFYNTGAVELPEFHLTGDGRTLKIAGKMDTKGYNFSISGSISLALLDSLADFITIGKGDAEIKIGIAGKNSDISTAGYINIYNGTLGFKGFPAVFENIETELSLAGNMLLIDGFYAKCGGGEIGIYGGIQHAVLIPQRYKISISLFDVTLPTILFGTEEEFPGTISGTLQFTGPADSPTLSGEIKVKQASYRQNVNWQTKLLKIRTRKLSQRIARPSGFKLNMNMKISIPDSIIIKNNLADLRIGGELSVLGASPDIYLLGELVFASGVIFFQSESFTLTSGIISFKDPTGINPFFDISGVTDKVDDDGQKYRITINISGTIDDTRVSFTSDPQLSEKDIISLLRYGVRSEKIELAGATSSEVYSFGGQVLIGELMKKEELKEILSSGIVDKVELHPYTSERGRTTTLLTLSKTFKDRFRLRYSTDVGGATQFMWATTEYSFGRYVSVIGSWDNEVLDNVTNKVGNLGIDFSIHFEF